MAGEAPIGDPNAGRPSTTHQAKVDLFALAAQRAVRYLEDERKDPVAPQFSRQETIDRLHEFSLDHPSAPEAVVDALADLGRRYAVRSTGGRYFGFVTGGTEPAALAASVLAGVWDQNAALPVMSPLAAAIEEVCVDQLLDVLALPPTATAAFCGGASVANLTAIVTARDALYRAVGWDVAKRGLSAAPTLTVFVSDEAHVSVLKALRLAGIGADSVVGLPVDPKGCVDPSRLPPVEGPTLVVLQAGNVNTGHSDPFAAINARFDDFRMAEWTGAGASRSSGPVWVHVDGAFGLWAAASPRLRPLVAGVDGADSWATDCHKWLNVPYDSGLAIVAEGEHLARSMSADAAYLQEPAGARSPMHLGLQMSQAARAIPVWATLNTLGRAGLADLVERCCDLAADFAARLEAAGADILCPVVLNQVLVAFGRSSGEPDRGAHDVIDDVTDAVVAATVATGSCWMGSTTWQGRRAMRISVSDIATGPADIEQAADAVIGAWHSVR